MGKQSKVLNSKIKSYNGSTQHGVIFALVFSVFPYIYNLIICTITMGSIRRSLLSSISQHQESRINAERDLQNYKGYIKNKWFTVTGPSTRFHKNNSKETISMWPDVHPFYGNRKFISRKSDGHVASFFYF